MSVGHGMTACIAALALVQAGAGACAMGQSSVTTNDCRVLDGDKLPAETGGSRALCEAIDAAARVHAPRERFSVEVRVLSPSMLAAVVTLKDGRKLPEQKIAVSDGRLNRRAMERFAEAIARQVVSPAGS